MTRPTSKLDSIGEKVCARFSVQDGARDVIRYVTVPMPSVQCTAGNTTRPKS